VRGDEPAREFLNSLDVKVHAKVGKWLAMLETHGPDLPRPYADVVDGPIRELRVGFGRLDIRMLYFIHGARVIVVAHGFMKKTRSIPERDIPRAHRAHADWLVRYGGIP
jgi:phage-related protein